MNYILDWIINGEKTAEPLIFLQALLLTSRSGFMQKKVVCPLPYRQCVRNGKTVSSTTDPAGWVD